MGRALEMAHVLDEARRRAHEVEPLTKTFGELSLDDAYLVQDQGVALRLGRGERVVGYKMGLTSEAKRRQMNLSQPIYGVLTDRMRVADGGVFELEGSDGRAIHPKIEPEIAFRIARELQHHQSDDAMALIDRAFAACDGVCPALEILDSRYVGFKYFSLPDVVADNASSSHFVLAGQWRRPDEIDLADLAITLEVAQLGADVSVTADFVPVHAARSSAISGHPARSLIELLGLLDARGLSLPAGSIVLAGAATQAVALEPAAGFRVVVEGMGTASVWTAGQRLPIRR